MGCGISGSKKFMLSPSTELNISRSHFVKQTTGSVHLKYEMVSEVGSGAFAKVHEAVQRETGAHRAIKVLPKLNLTDEDKARFINEFELLRRTDHPNIVTLYEYYEDNHNFYLVQEMCSGGELLTIILNRQQGFSEVRAAFYIKQVLSAVCHCHSLNIVHRDLKPDNLLLENKHPSSMLKVIDFGISCLKSTRHKLTQRTGTIQYMAPEIFKNSYNEKCDIWSCGVILFILLSGKMPFGGSTDREIIQAITRGKYTMIGPEWTSITEEAKTLVKKMLQVDPLKRPSAEECFNDPWIRTCEERLKPESLSKAIENLRAFKAGTKLKRAVLTYMVSQLIPQTERQDLNRVFMSLDTSGDGRLNAEELQAGFQRLGFNLTKNEAEEILKNIDTDNNGFIDYSEFIMAAMPKEQLLSKERIIAAFNSFDTDGNGKISQVELRTILELNCDLLLQELLNEVDENGDGEIDLEEFSAMLLEQS
mmetsp:Transcript_6408/g.11143  ORF Transcript_6408/g.11143 Transcript_6408/m.11143 type:complete len:477 (+) Transcript_6408:1555-2985(+)